MGGFEPGVPEDYFQPGFYPPIVLVLPALGAALALFMVGCLLFRALGWRVLRDPGEVDRVGKEHEVEP
jgi:hypothetical protein